MRIAYQDYQFLALIDVNSRRVVPQSIHIGLVALGRDIRMLPGFIALHIFTLKNFHRQLFEELIFHRINSGFVHALLQFRASGVRKQFRIVKVIRILPIELHFRAAGISSFTRFYNELYLCRVHQCRRETDGGRYGTSLEIVRSVKLRLRFFGSGYIEFQLPEVSIHSTVRAWMINQIVHPFHLLEMIGKRNGHIFIGHPR